jgi:large repetitive protein
LVASGAPYAVTVTYSGDTNFTGSTAGLAEQVQLAVATVKAKIAKSASSATVTAKVKAPPGGSVPTGTVTFVVTNKHGTVINCKRGNVWDLDSSAQATCSLSGLSAANSPYSVTIVYPGNADYGRSVSAPRTFTG